MSFAHVPHIIPVLSGKGGVGKSSVTVQLALSLSLLGHHVGVLDIDLTGPSIPRLFGIEEAKIKQAPGGWLPVTVHEASSAEDAQGDEPAKMRTGALYCLSLGFLLPKRGDAVVWRGPKKTAMVKQLLSDVLWPKDLDVLLVDTPPGTSDEHIAMVTELLSKTTPASRLGAVVVTTPQKVATSDVRKELSFCKTVGLKVLGVVENMAGFVCPCCGEVTQIFRAHAADEAEGEQRGGGEIMAHEWGVKFLASVPLDGECWALLVEQGKRPVYKPVEANMHEAAEDEDDDLDSEDDRDDNKEFEDADAEAMEQPQPDPGRLVDKYTDCKLYGIFSGIAQQILEGQGLVPTGP